jgi:hypothetical protein
MRSALSAVAFLALLAFSPGVRAQNTDLLLVLAADVSRSIDEGEFELQRKGYAAALTDPRVLAAIRGGTNGTVAVCFVEWSGAGEQLVVVDWTVIHDEEDAGRYPNPGRLGTDPRRQDLMERAAEPHRQSSVSGDGNNSAGRSPRPRSGGSWSRRSTGQPGYLPHPAARRPARWYGRM